MGFVAEGVSRLGYKPVWQRPQGWQEHEAQDFDLVLTMGVKTHSACIASLYKERGVPVLVVDLPPIRKPRLWALWPGEVNKLPEAAPPHRLRLVRFERQPLGEKILVCGQKANDAAHRMDKATLRDYFTQTVAMLKVKHPDKRIVWRPHPQEPFSLSAEQSDPEAETLAEALVGCGALVTFNSTCGVEALLAGVPVFCDPSSFYREVTAPGLPQLGGRDVLPEDESLCDFFSRLTHVCWDERELATPEPYRQTLERMAA